MIDSNWTNIAGVFNIEVFVEGGKLFDANGQELPLCPDKFDDGDEIAINFLSSGYYQAARTNGPADNWVPEEGEEWRDFADIWIGEVELDTDEAWAIWDVYYKEVNDVELDFYED